VSLKNQLESELGIPIRLRAGTPGSLNVILNSESIFSKKQSGRYPTAAELVRVIREKTAINSR